MSGKQVKKPTAKPKPKPTDEVKPAPVEAPAAQEVAEQKPATEKPIHQNFNISDARVRRHLDKLNMNKEIDALLKPLKAKLAAHEKAKKALAENCEHETVVEEQVKMNEKGKEVKTKVSKDIVKPLTEARRKELTAAVDEFAPQFNDARDKAAALAKERIRFSSDAPVVLSITFDELVNQLLEHAMDRVLLADKKIIQIEHLHEPGVEQLPLYPLIKTLPTWTKVADELAKSRREAELAEKTAAAVANAEKEFKKKYAALLALGRKKAAKAEKKDAVPAEEVPAAEPVAAPAPVVEAPKEDKVEAEDPTEDAKDKTTFNFYINNACKALIKSNERYSKVRVSTEIRKYISTLLIELIARLATLIKLTTDSMKVKTVNNAPILNTIRALLVDGHSPNESITFVAKKMVNPDTLKAEQTKRDASLAARELAAKEGKPLPAEYTFDVNQFPKDYDGFEAKRTLTFDTAKYDKLHKTIMDKLVVEKQ